MQIDITRNNSLVCGSTSGIGKAVALELAESGSNVTLFARNEVKLKRVLNELPVRNNQKHNYLTADFSNPESVNSKIKEYINAGHIFHIVINNTGGPRPGTIMESGAEDFLLGINTHLISFQHIVKNVIPGMKKGKFGRIINIISTSVKSPIPGLGVSNTVRGAVASWAKTLAGELGPFGITVNNILPGYTDTDRLAVLFDKQSAESAFTTDELKKQVMASIPCRRFADPKETAYAVVFLASEKAAYINGINLPVDGGNTQCL